MRSRTRPAYEVPSGPRPKYARQEMTSPPEDAARCLACALTCGCHSDSVSCTSAFWSRLFGVVEAPER
ncbi:hypothetical protein ABZ791_37815 [Streptomyces huasconensis]|uniref:Uncharacterized protein n=1 Tax=Streptomyces huasconensis TaxID=1854574 RepID=A0ABV3M776_9ACTN